MSTRGVLLRGDDGIALAVSMMVMGVILMLGLAMLSVTDTQTRESGVERVRESSFNLAEGALEQQSFVLSGKGWPGTEATSAPAACELFLVAPRCPTPESLVPATGAGAYAGADYAQGVRWTTKVRDNVVAYDQSYRPQNVDGSQSWDRNADGLIWVRSWATVGGKTRSIVALLKRDSIPILLPKASLVARSLTVGFNAQKDPIQGATTAAPVLRCGEVGCGDYTDNRGQSLVDPPPVIRPVPPPNTPFVPADVVAKLVDSATTYTSCPTASQAQGIVVIDIPDHDGDGDGDIRCQYAGNSVFNSAASPGVLIMRRGVLEFFGTGAGGGKFYGLLLHLNEGGRTGGDCVTVTGNTELHGGVILEGGCGFRIDGSATLKFDPNRLNPSVSGVAGVVQNTWQEVPPNDDWGPPST